jgi:hypothetical protein
MNSSGVIVTVSAPTQHNRPILFGAIAVLLFTAVAIAAGSWWNKHNSPSQASKADCTLAQKIIDEAQHLPGDKAAVEKWEQSTLKMRRSQMKDGYLGFTIAQYEEWAALKAKGEGTPPRNKEVAQLAEKANAHCSDARVTLAFPPLAS